MSRSVFTLFFFIFFLSLNVVLSTAFTTPDADMEDGNGCSRHCESSFCSIPPLLKYGKYCGLGYTGCPGEVACDGLDACCQGHDACVQANGGDLFSQFCNDNFLECIAAFKAAGGPSGFMGNTCDTEHVADLIHYIIEAALWTGKVVNDP